MSSEPVNIWVSSKLSPNWVDPELYEVDAVTYRRSTIVALPVTSILVAVTVPKLPELTENIVIR